MEQNNMNSNNTSEIKKKKKWLVPVIISSAAVIFGAILAIGFIFTIVAKPKIKVQKQLNLGDKYITEMDYENAVLAYQEAIRIDPKNEAAYLGLADAYINLSDECLQNGDTDGATKYLKLAAKEAKAGFDNTDSDEIADKIEEIEDKKAEIESDENEEIDDADKKEEEQSEIKEDDKEAEVKEEPFAPVELSSLPAGLEHFISPLQWSADFDCENEQNMKNFITWNFGNPNTLIDFSLYSDHLYVPSYEQMEKDSNFYIQANINDWQGIYMYDAAGMDWILKNIYNVSDSMLKDLKTQDYYETLNDFNGKAYKELSYENGKYHVKSEQGWGGPGYETKIISAEKSGNVYHIKYDWIPETDYADFMELKHYYAIMEYKVIDGKGYWSVYKTSKNALF